MSSEWRNLSEEQREKYNKLADEDKSRYANEKKDYDEKKKTEAAVEDKSESEEKPVKKAKKASKKKSA